MITIALVYIAYAYFMITMLFVIIIHVIAFCVGMMLGKAIMNFYFYCRGSY